MRERNRPITRFVLLAGIAASILMVATEVFFYRPLWSIPESRTSCIEALGLLVVYGLVVLWATEIGGVERQNVMAWGTGLGLIGVAIEIVQLVQEDFANLAPPWNALATLGLQLTCFTLWGMAGSRTARTTKSFRAGVAAGSWSAMVTMSITVLFGFVLEFYLKMPKPEYVATWAEFKRSGWSDTHAFAIANTVDSAQSHLFLGPVIGGILGAVGAASRTLLKARPSLDSQRPQGLEP